MTANEVKRVLALEPHPREGGWFRRTHQSETAFSAAIWAEAGLRFDGLRQVSSAIYYLLEPETFSEMHRLGSEEIFHHYGGGAVEMLQLWPDGQVVRLLIGTDLLAGERPQVVVPRGVWQGSRMLPGSGEGWALLGCTVMPGFAYADYQSGSREELTRAYPGAQELIGALTRSEQVVRQG